MAARTLARSAAGGGPAARRACYQEGSLSQQPDIRVFVLTISLALVVMCLRSNRYSMRFDPPFALETFDDDQHTADIGSRGDPR
jgi:hypothetical protein